jgi:ATP-dependent 26S proteasome regulatory subunit
MSRRRAGNCVDSLTVPCLCLPSPCSHAIVSSAVGPEYYVGITSFVDKTQLEPGCSVLLHNKVCCKLVAAH